MTLVRSYKNRVSLANPSYKCEGAYASDTIGTTDNVEFVNILKDKVLAYPVAVRRTYLALVMDGVVCLFVRASRWGPTRC